MSDAPSHEYLKVFEESQSFRLFKGSFSVNSFPERSIHWYAKKFIVFTPVAFEVLS